MIWAPRGAHCSPGREARDEECRCLHEYHPISLRWHWRRKDESYKTKHWRSCKRSRPIIKNQTPKEIKIISYNMEQAGRSRRRRNIFLRMLRLSKTLQRCFLKQAPQKNDLLLFDGFFSTSPIMGQAHEEGVGEVVREGNTCFSFKRLGFWKKKGGNWTTGSSILWKYLVFNPRKMDPLFVIWKKKKRPKHRPLLIIGHI